MTETRFYINEDQRRGYIFFTKHNNRDFLSWKAREDVTCPDLKLSLAAVYRRSPPSRLIISTVNQLGRDFSRDKRTFTDYFFLSSSFDTPITLVCHAILFYTPTAAKRMREWQAIIRASLYSVHFVVKRLQKTYEPTKVTKNVSSFVSYLNLFFEFFLVFRKRGSTFFSIGTRILFLQRPSSKHPLKIPKILKITPLAYQKAKHPLVPDYTTPFFMQYWQWLMTMTFICIQPETIPYLLLCFRVNKLEYTSHSKLP